MRKLVSIAVSAALMLSLAACGKADDSAAAMPESKSIESNSPASSAASAASDTESNESDIQFDESFQPQTIADNDTCTIILQNVGYDDSCGYYWTVDFQGYTAKAYYENKTNDRIDVILDKGSINGFECTPGGTTLLEPHSNAYVDIRWQEYAETYAENGNDPTSITEIVMPVFVRKDTGNNTVYIDATYSIDPQARTATPIVNPQ